MRCILVLVIIILFFVMVVYLVQVVVSHLVCVGGYAQLQLFPLLPLSQCCCLSILGEWLEIEWQQHWVLLLYLITSIPKGFPFTTMSPVAPVYLSFFPVELSPSGPSVMID